MVKPEPGTMLPNDTPHPLTSPVRSRYGKLLMVLSIMRSALDGAHGVRFASFSVRADSIRSVLDCARASGPAQKTKRLKPKTVICFDRVCSLLRPARHKRFQNAWKFTLAVDLMAVVAESLAAED